jgi:hypothetical protein
MATRALIGTIETDAAGNQVLTSTYNHYDGYPDNLGVALNKHYDESQSAKQISNQGYISYLDPETGAIDAKHKEAAGKDVLPDNFEEAMYEVHAIADSMGADYVYLYDFDAFAWLDSRNASKALINKFKMSGIDNQFEAYEDDPDNPLGIPGDNALGLEEGDYITEWKSFLNEGTFDAAEKIKDLMIKLKDEPKDNVELYLDSVKRDIKRGDVAQYQEMSIEDMVEDYENYIQDRMDS